MRRLVPDFILQQYRAGRERGYFHAAAMFADLSGFSKMTDALARHGQAGAEVLASVMRVFFGPLVEAVYAQGGFVVGYTGDAFTAVFIDDDSEDSAVMRCLAAAWKIQEYTRTHPETSTSLGTFPISLKVGLGFGETSWQIFRSADGRRATYCVRGESIRSAVNAEECAEPGTIMLDSNGHALLRSKVDSQPWGDCFRIYGVKVDLPSARSFADPEPDPKLIEVFCPEEVLHLPVVGEFRQVVNLFVDIPAGISDEALVKPFIETVFDLQARYGGFFLRPELGDKGFNLLMVWGAPAAHETDVDRAVNFIRELSAVTRLPLRAGISYRIAYAGFMGASLREDYTAYGWGVNLAARLMNHANVNEIWLDEEIAQRAKKHFEIRYLDGYEFKGFSARQKVFILAGRKALADTVYHGELVGRRAELDRLARFASPLIEGKFAGVFVVQGESGIGKSRLVHAFQISSFFDKLPANWIICQTDEILRQPLNPFRGWLERCFHYSNTQSDEVNLENFTRSLQDLLKSIPDRELAAELLRTSSVLSAVLGLRQPDSLYEQLDAKERYENTFLSLSALLRAQSLLRPVVLFFEDVHWLDDETLAFISYFIRSITAEEQRDYPIAIIATQRSTSAFDAAVQEARPQVLNLTEFSSAELGRIAENVLGAPVSPSLQEWLEKRTEGNPFFAEQLVRYLLERRMLQTHDDGRFYAAHEAESSLPTDVRAVLIARLDGVSREVREMIQTAAVLGREFDIRLLMQMLPRPERLMDLIERAEQAEIWFRLNDTSYLFRHAMLRDAAYSMQLAVRQRELHALAMVKMEKLYAEDLNAHYSELAYHAEHGNLSEKAHFYLRKAAKASADAYQNAQALDYYDRVLALTPPDDLELQFDLLMEQTTVLSRMGDRSAQAHNLNLLEDLANQLHDHRHIAQSLMMHMDYAFTIGNYPDTIAYAERVVSLAQEIQETAILLEAYRLWPLALMHQGKLDEAIRQAQVGLELARRAERRLEEGNLLNTMGLIALEQQNPAEAYSYFEKSLSIARETQNRAAELNSLNNMGNAAGFVQGNYLAARNYYEQVYTLARERGDRYREGIALGNLGWAAGMQGDFASARNYLGQALIIARQVGNQYQETYMLINLSNVAGIQGDALAALQFAEQAVELARKTGERSGEAWGLLYLGHAFTLCRQYERARQAFETSLLIRRELNQPSLALEPMAGLVQLALEVDDAEFALKWTEEVLEYLSNGGTLEGTEEPLRIYLACFQTLEMQNDPRASAVLNKAVALLDAQASRFNDDESRRSYIENVPWRRAIRDAWTAINGR
jgi:predicted ATPase/class 3 adenylate cyclase